MSMMDPWGLVVGILCSLALLVVDIVGLRRVQTPD